MEHHIQRCGSILNIVAAEEMHADEIARLYFDEFLLKGPGKLMAANEIVSHAELLTACGDLKVVSKNSYIATGSQNFEDVIQACRQV